MPELFGIDGFGISNIKHKGIKGMKWYQRRFQNPDGSLTEAGRKRYLKDAQKITKKKEKEEEKERRAEENAAKKEAKNRIKTAKEKADIVRRNDVDEIIKKSYMFTTDELNDIYNRQNTLQKLKPSKKDNAPKSKIDRFLSVIDTGTKIADTGVKSFNSYNRAVGVVNAIAKKKVLPDFDIAKARKRRINNTPLDEFLRNAQSYTDEEIRQRTLRETSLRRLRTYAP